MFQGISHPETTYFVLSAYLSGYIKFNNGSKSVIFNFDFFELKFLRANPSLKPHICFGNGPDIWHGFPVILHIKVNNGREPAIFIFS